VVSQDDLILAQTPYVEQLRTEKSQRRTLS